ncbi:hypothetical protein [Tropicibacter sp. Alg240-R139]|uniref:hypothetical protein n=1 Tax=Tropicibacter sp. Alg240-R139 TaxID=2305991 RepID=UPI0013DEDEF0|nr:hypothetical protein [Tropicibacter sp. Alg240-R139]
MNTNQIINMIMRTVMRRLVNTGVNAGFDAAAKMGKPKSRRAPPAPDVQADTQTKPKVSPEERERIRAIRQARRAARTEKQG